MKARFLGGQLQRRFVLVMTATIIIMMTLAGAWIVRRESALLFKGVELRGRLLAETLAIPMLNDMIYERLGLVEEGGLIDNYVNEIFQKKDLDLLYISVLDSDGRIVSHSDFKQYGKLDEDPLSSSARQADQTLTIRYHDPGTGHEAMAFSTPLSIGKKRWGTLRLAMSLERAEQEVRVLIVRVVAVTVGLLVLGFIAIIALNKRFIGPISELADIMQQAGGERLDVKVNVKGDDEVALLGLRFNEMIDRIKSATEELKQTNEKLYRSEKLASIGVLATGVAHEINNPLGGLMNCVEMLDKKGSDEDFRARYLGLMRTGLGRIETTVSKLLWMARDRDRAAVPVHVGRMLASLYNFLEYRFERYRVKYVADVDDDLVVKIATGDVEQVLMNLMINAIQAMPSGGTLTITARGSDQFALIEVADTGQGIPPQDIGKVFDPFFTTKPPGEGTGLGLWLSYEIIKNYGGDISVLSTQENGTTFTIKLPLGEL